MLLSERIKANPKLKALALRLLMPRNQARPRLWVKWFLNPVLHHYGKHSLIRRNTRMDILPFNKFSLGNESTIEDYVTVNNGVGDVIIGDNARIGLSCTIIGPVKMGEHVRLAQCITISGLNHNYEDVTMPISEQGVNTAPIVIDDDVWIGANSVILAGVHIGKHSVVAAGSVVTKNVPAYCVVAGNPARLLKQYNEETKTWERVKK